MKEILRPTRLIIDLGAIGRNARAVLNRIDGKAEMIAVVKADAYGHGLIPVSRKLLLCGASSLAVALTEEGIALREAGIVHPILVMGGLNEASARANVLHHLTSTVYDTRTLQILQDEAEKLSVTATAHLKLDTGMTRIGIRNANKLEELLTYWKGCQRVEMEAAYTHFSTSDEVNLTNTHMQNDLFRDFIAIIHGNGFMPKLHAANSATIAKCPTMHYDYVRAGIALYGSAEFDKSLGVEPAQRWVTMPTRIEIVPSSVAVGYGGTFVTNRETTVMTLPVGYGDGYHRTISNKGYVLVKGKRAKILGRVCMDQIMVDVTDISGASLNDVVVLLGKQGEDAITPDEMASWADTISYEIMLSINNRVPKVYIDSDTQ